MIINSATIIYFSPTGTTKKVINSIIRGMGIASVNTIDLTSYKTRNSVILPIEDDIVLIGVPVYEEGIPKILVPFLTSLKGNNKPVVLIAVYGNICEGTTLNELYNITKNLDFKVIGAGSFIGEHSFSTKEIPVAEGRPNYDDLINIEEFGRNIIKKTTRINYLSYASLKIPKGKKLLMVKILPQNSARIFTKTPVADMNICNRCGVCVNLCPMGAIDRNTLEINEYQCLRCFCCVKKCPKKARKIVYRMKFPVSQVLVSKNKIKKESKIYL